MKGVRLPGKERKGNLCRQKKKGRLPSRRKGGGARLNPTPKGEKRGGGGAYFMGKSKPVEKKRGETADRSKGKGLRFSNSSLLGEGDVKIFLQEREESAGQVTREGKTSAPWKRGRKKKVLCIRSRKKIKA